jgi:hypothetical protein
MNLVTLTITTPTAISMVEMCQLSIQVRERSSASKYHTGSYTIVYQICDSLNPHQYDSATVTVNVAAPSIDALNDTIAVANGTTGNPTAGNVLLITEMEPILLTERIFIDTCDINYHYASNGYQWWKCASYRSNYRTGSTLKIHHGKLYYYTKSVIT